MELIQLSSCTFLLETMSGVPEMDWDIAKVGNKFRLKIPDLKCVATSEADAEMTPETKERLAHQLLCAEYPHFSSWRDCVFEVMDKVQIKMEEEMAAAGLTVSTKNMRFRAIGALRLV